MIYKDRRKKSHTRYRRYKKRHLKEPVKIELVDKQWEDDSEDTTILDLNDIQQSYNEDNNKQITNSVNDSNKQVSINSDVDVENNVSLTSKDDLFVNEDGPIENKENIFLNEDEFEEIDINNELNVDDDKAEEKLGITNKIKAFVKDQQEQHNIEKTARINKIKEAKSAKYEQTQNLKIKKIELKETKDSIKRAKKELKLAKKQDKGLISSIVIAVFATVAILLFFTVRWLFKTWPNLQISELLYEVTAPLEGTGNDQIINYFKLAGIPTIIIVIILIVIMIILYNTSKQIRRRGKQIIIVVSCVLIVISGFRFYSRLDLGNYVQSQSSTSDFIELNYIDPASTEITFPETKRNLIMIYCESMEMTYSDLSNGGGFENNYIPELTQLSEENENFSGSNETLNGANSLSYTTWTMGGLFASSSGLPLKIDIGGNDMDTQESFFPGITTLGDILEDEGYTNIFACGSDATFGGRRLYFNTHGNYECRDINYRKENGQLDQDYYVWWGFEDSKLIEWAKEDLSVLGESNQPFNYTMLTVDTHFEDGYVCDQCVDQWGEQYGNVISCSSRQVSELVSWIQEQPWYENTTIVITGDHPTMDVDFCNPVSEDYDRKVYIAYINATPVENNSEGMRIYSTFDTFPTTLASLGTNIVGNKLGLGTNLYSGIQTLTEEYGVEEENTQLGMKSQFMMTISGVDTENTTAREREGVVANVSTRIESYQDNTATFVVDDIYNTAGSLQYIEFSLSDSSGNAETKQMEYQGDGSFKVEMNISDGNIDNVYLRVDVVTEKDEEEIRETSYEYSGPLWLMSINESSLTEFLEGLQNLDKSRYTIFMTMKNETGENLNETDRSLLSSLGVSSLADGGGNASFAVIAGEEIYTRSGNEYIRDNSYLSSGIPFVVSSSANELQDSSILIGWTYDEYCLNGNGLNIVIWDNETNSVIKQSCFDCNTLLPTASISSKSSLLNKNITLYVEDIKNVDNVSGVIATIYDNEDISTETIYLSLNENNQYQGTLENHKDIIDTKVIKLYVLDSDGNRKYIGTLD